MSLKQMCYQNNDFNIADMGINFSKAEVCGVTYNQNQKMFVKTSSKVTPIGLQQLNHNNFVPKNITSIHCVKYQICAASVFAINRLFLLKPNRWILISSYVYTIFLPFVVLITMFEADDLGTTYSAFKYTCCTEYILLTLVTLFANKNKFFKLFQDLDKFDQLLNITKDGKIVNSGFTGLYWVLGTLSYSILEYTGCYFYLTYFIDRTVYCFYAMLLAHDFEQVLFFLLLRTIYLRLRMIKAHVMKMFIMEARRNNRGKLNKVEELANNTQLDISSLHKVYDLLHKCTEQLNSIMSLPMLIILFTAGLATTALLKMMVTVIQTVTVSTTFGISTVVYLLGRGMKFTFLVVVPCYYSRVTSAEVTTIRTVLHDAVNSFPLDKIERRKVKAFIQLTKENDFTYAIGGMIKLNMSLPLSYLSLCTTYLVISIQFSKFFD